MKTIYKLDINTSDMPAAATTRKFVVRGEVGSEFIIYVFQNDTIKFYDFSSKTFALGHNSSNNNLKVKLRNKTFSSQIAFPSGGGTYTIKLEAAQGSQVLGADKNVISKSIDKAASNVTVTLQAATTNTNNYSTFSTTTSTGAPGRTTTNATDFTWAITNVSNDSYGFGFRIGGSGTDVTTISDIAIQDNWWYFSTTDTVDGAVTSSTTVVLDDVTDIGAGMIISSVSAGSLSGTPYILSVDTDTKTITMSSGQTFSDGITLTFKAEGWKAISTAIGGRIEFGTTLLEGNPVTKTIRAGSSGTTINLNGTYGIMGGGHAYVTGLNIDNESSTTTVSSVSASSSAGSIVVNNSQSGLTTASTLTFNNAYQTINIIGTVLFAILPSSNKTIYLDIDKFLTKGAAS